MNDLPWLILVAANGACVGSFLNVVIYRLPEGLSIVSPPSSCPRCGHRLAWYDNVPVLGWLWLRGKCRYCKAPISAQYPIIEAVTALLFVGLFWAYYHGGTRPTWQTLGFTQTWPALIVHLMLVAGLLASTVIDARLYIIPLQIPWTNTLLALIVLPLASWWMSAVAMVSPAVSEASLLHATLAATAGLAVANTLLAKGVLKRSFDEDPAAHDAATPVAVATGVEAPLGELAHSTSTPTDADARAAAGTASAHGVPVAIDPPLLVKEEVPPLSGPAESPADESTSTAAPDPHEFLKHPHPRREVLKELLFLSLPVTAAVLAYFLVPSPTTPYPDALQVLAGVLLGYLVGGGMIWITRILGTLGFGKEAMGLGDVHLLAAIGAVLGAYSAVLVFFVAPFLGLAYALISIGLSRMMKGQVRVIPYGPYLALAAVIVMVWDLI